MIPCRGMYDTDTPALTPLGLPVVSTYKNSLLRVRGLCTQYQTQLRTRDETAVEDPDRTLVTMMWMTRWQEFSLESQGTALSDHLYYVRCLQIVVTSPAPCADFEDLHELYARVQLLGCNHGSEWMWVASDIEELERRCASLIVYRLWEKPSTLEPFVSIPLPPLSAELHARMWPLRYVADTHAPPVPLGQDPAPPRVIPADDCTWDLNEGSYWHSDRATVLRDFTRMCSRVFRWRALEFDVLRRFPVVAFPVVTDAQRAHLLAWLRDQAEVDASDNSPQLFRAFVYEHWLPAGAREECFRSLKTRWDRLPSQNVLEEQLGGGQCGEFDEPGARRVPRDCCESRPPGVYAVGVVYAGVFDSSCGGCV